VQTILAQEFQVCLKNENKSIRVDSYSTPKDESENSKRFGTSCRTFLEKILDAKVAPLPCEQALQQTNEGERRSKLHFHAEQKSGL